MNEFNTVIIRRYQLKVKGNGRKVIEKKELKNENIAILKCT